VQEVLKIIIRTFKLIFSGIRMTKLKCPQFTCGQFVKDHVVPEDSHYTSAMQQMQEDVLVII